MKRTTHQRFSVAATLASLVAAGCGGGGGGGGGVSDSTPPALIAAAFAGATATPAANDTMLLSFAENVTATTGAAIDATQLAVSGGGSLGTGCTVLDQPTTRSVRLTLGAGVAFTPGVTTIDFAATHDAIVDAAGNAGAAGNPIVIGDSDGFAPVVTNLTLDAIDDALNGTGTAGGVLQVPQNGFTIDLTWFDLGTPTVLGVVAARTVVTANVSVGSSSGTLPPGTNLTPLLLTVTGTTSVGSFQVPAAMTFATGAVTLTATAVDGGGLASTPVTFAFTVKAWTEALRPFETTVHSQQVWFLDLSRDIEQFSTTTITGGASVLVNATANSRADWLDILFVLGLQSNTPIPNTSGGLDSNQFVQQRFRDALLANLASFFQGANVSFTFTPPGGSFGSSSSVPYASLGHSQICIGGSDDDDVFDILGVAQLDPSNQRQNNDCLLESPSNVRLGVFLHTIADVNLGPPSGSTFRVAFNPIAPAVGGTPVGEVAGDENRLTGVTSDTRSSRIDAAIAGLARFVAVIVAHEAGHSMGLVVNGVMPTGLYGNDPAFPGSSSGHISTPLLFPLGGVNIMSPQLGYPNSIDSHTAFNSLNLAYLRERAFYGN